MRCLHFIITSLPFNRNKPKENKQVNIFRSYTGYLAYSWLFIVSYALVGHVKTQNMQTADGADCADWGFLINIYLSFIYLFLSLFFYLICIFSLGIIYSLFTSKLVSRNFSRYTVNVNRHTEQHLWRLFSSGISSMAHHSEIRS